ncbi:hypothetical protein DICVIV_04020 [Dictyocaulus viviparus]|uniref:Uncharacterized protein n=1 Tax=Dictyocaulus viviparus TaxID=29172 RepID=A0A0D8Y5K1_DICVI|nr:hypothetical protein DICVIV_04020 [Dictyocaulus viviparus]
MPKMFFENAEKEKRVMDISDKKVQRELAQASAEICDPDELLSICLEFIPAPPVGKTEDDSVFQHPSTSTQSQSEPPLKKAKKCREQREIQQSFRRFFRCAAKVPIRTLRRLLETKLFLTDQFSVHFLSDRDYQDISDDVTIRTLVLDGGFDRSRPFRLFFTLVPTVNDDAPPVLDAEAMPCLMPEAPVHHETIPSVPQPGQLQPVQIVSPVVPALTVSLSTDIYGHSAPIITPQSAPRKRRKLSDPKKSPTEKSPPTNTTHQPQIAPNMLVGPLIRPMFITQPPFMHRSPPNVHVSHVPFTHPSQVSTPNENAASKKCGTPNINDNTDRPPQLQREDPVSSLPVREALKPCISSSGSLDQKECGALVVQQTIPSVLEATQQLAQAQSLQNSSCSNMKIEESETHRHVSATQEDSYSSEIPKSDILHKTNQLKSLPNSEAPRKPEPKTAAKVVTQHKDLEQKPLSPYASTVIKISESPPILEAMPSQSRSQSSDKKPPRENSQAQNSISDHTISNGITISSPVQSFPSEHTRPVQTVLPQILNGDIRIVSFPKKPRTPPHFFVKNELTKAELITATNTNSDLADCATSPAPAAPMDFRRMATLNKQSLGRTLQAVLSSGRAANADASKTVANNGGTSVDVKGTPINGKINKESAIDLNFPKSKSLST